MANKALLDYLGEYEEEISNSSESNIDTSKNTNDDLFNINGSSDEEPVITPTKIDKEQTVAPLQFNIIFGNKEEEELRRIREEMKKIDLFLEEERKQMNTIAPPEEEPLEVIELDISDEETSIDKFLRESKLIWESKQNKQEEAEHLKENITTDKVVNPNKKEKTIPNKRTRPSTNYNKFNAAEQKGTKTVEQKNEKEEEKYNVMELLQQAETCYPDEWLAVYEKAQRSRKNNYAVELMKKGRFRINENHQQEFLPEIRTDNKSIDDLLTMKWI